MPVKYMLLCAGILLLLIGSGCRARDRGGKADFARPLAAGESALQELRQHEYPRFSLRQTDVQALRQGIGHSMTFLQSPSATRHFPINNIRHAQVQRGLQQLDQLLQQRPHLTDNELNDYIRRHFRIFRSVGYDRRGSVLFTGYYTPIFKASKRRHGIYQFPLYKRPADLVSGKTGKDMAHQRLANGALVAYPSREEIERSGMLRGTELVWLPTALDAYIIHVQGSARLQLDSGEELEIGYDGTNGHEYLSVGLELVNDGKIPKDQLSLSSMRRFFKHHPHEVDRYLRRNPRFVFFQETRGGPFGSLGPPVTADISIATDKSIFPRGALCWVAAVYNDPHMRRVDYGGFRLDQDTGGAIRAPGKCDLYMGIGRHAERRAGSQMSVGQLYYLVAR